MKNTNYRLHYERLTNKPLPKEFEIHHLDSTHNHAITNLVAVPIELHKKYHRIINKKIRPNLPDDFTLKSYKYKDSIVVMQFAFNYVFNDKDYWLSRLLELREVLIQVVFFVNKRDILLKK